MKLNTEEGTPWGGTLGQWLGVTKEESALIEERFPNTLAAWKRVCSEVCGVQCSCLKMLIGAASLDIGNGGRTS